MKRILEIIADCEAIQESKESDYTKIQAIVSAYKEIREELRYGEEADVHPRLLREVE